jgi:hypothetical protein
MRMAPGSGAWCGLSSPSCGPCIGLEIRVSGVRFPLWPFMNKSALGNGLRNVGHPSWVAFFGGRTRGPPGLWDVLKVVARSGAPDNLQPRLPIHYYPPTREAPLDPRNWCFPRPSVRYWVVHINSAARRATIESTHDIQLVVHCCRREARPATRHRGLHRPRIGRRIVDFKDLPVRDLELLVEYAGGSVKLRNDRRQRQNRPLVGRWVIALESLATGGPVFLAGAKHI